METTANDKLKQIVGKIQTVLEQQIQLEEAHAKVCSERDSLLEQQQQYITQLTQLQKRIKTLQASLSEPDTTHLDKADLLRKTAKIMEVVEDSIRQTNIDLLR